MKIHSLHVEGMRNAYLSITFAEMCGFGSYYTLKMAQKWPKMVKKVKIFEIIFFLRNFNWISNFPISFDKKNCSRRNSTEFHISRVAAPPAADWIRTRRQIVSTLPFWKIPIKKLEELHRKNLTSELQKFQKTIQESFMTLRFL